MSVKRADTTELVYFGRAADQVLTAHGSRISKVVVWRSPTDGSFTDQIKLYICHAETLDTGEVRSMARRGIIAESAIVASSGPITTPVAIEFTFDPPVMLPGTGLQYGFAVRDELMCFGIFALEAVAGNEYAGGDLWTTGPVLDCQDGASPGFPLRPADLAFEITFCGPEVDARELSWGMLKAIYR